MDITTDLSNLLQLTRRNTCQFSEIELQIRKLMEIGSINITFQKAGKMQKIEWLLVN